MKISRIMLLVVSLAGLFLSFAGNVSALTTADTEEIIFNSSPRSGYFTVKTKIYTGKKLGQGGEAFGDGSASSPLFATFHAGVTTGGVDNATISVSGEDETEIEFLSAFVNWDLDVVTVDFKIRNK